MVGGRVRATWRVWRDIGWALSQTALTSTLPCMPRSHGGGSPGSTRLGWSVRKCSWTDYEIRSPFAELVIEAEAPILMHGPVSDVEANADRILAPLRDAGVGYCAEFYTADGSLLREHRWGTL